jgi:glycogen synthase
MRLLLLTWEHAPDGRDGHGAPSTVLARHLVALGHEVHVVTRAPGHTAGPVVDEVAGVRVLRVPEAPPMIPGWDQVATMLSSSSRLQAAAMRVARDVDLDVVHVVDRRVTDAAIALTDTFDLPVVATLDPTMRDLHPDLPAEHHRFFDQVERWLTDRAVRVVAGTRVGADRLCADLGVPADRVDHVPVPLDLLDDVAPVPALAGPRTRTVAVLGRLDDAGLDRLLTGLADLRAGAGAVTLVVAAHGLDEREVRRRARQAGHRHHVLVRPDPPLTEVGAVAAAADVAVVVDDDRPGAATAVAAAVSGTPVVVTGSDRLVEATVALGHAAPPDELLIAVGEVLAGTLARPPAEVTAGAEELRARHDPRTVAAAMAERYVAATRTQPTIARRGGRPTSLRPVDEPSLADPR